MKIPDFPEFQVLRIEYISLQVPLIEGYVTTASAYFKVEGLPHLHSAEVHGDDIAACWTHLVNHLRAKDLAHVAARDAGAPSSGSLLSLTEIVLDEPAGNDDEEIPF